MRQPEPLLYAPDVEVIPHGEAADIQRSLQTLRTILQESTGALPYDHGQIHTKTHGRVHGELRTIPNLPPELAQGVFAGERTYEVVARFSNSATRSQADFIPDGRGLAIKLKNVNGPFALLDSDETGTQDFVMVNHPVFFARDVADFMRIEDLLVADPGNALVKLQQAFTGGEWNPLNWNWRGTVNAIQNASHLPSHPATNTYYSMTPIRFGRYVAKYRAKPAGDLGVSLVDIVSKLGNEKDGMRLMLEETLRSQHILFEFQVQLRTSNETMPVEDAAVEWPESQSPYRTVALLLIPRQEIADPLRNVNPRPDRFNVWHCIDEHRPLGGINRLRRQVYPLAANWRLQSETGSVPV